MSTSVSPGDGNGATDPNQNITVLEKKLDPTLDFFAGTAAGISGLVVGFPFDTVKYRFQNPSPNARYRSTFHALVTITREERLHGLFKGISSPLATAPVMNGMLFATYHFFTKLQMRHDKDAQNHDQQPTLGQIFLAGACCGLASTLLTTPIELIKIQQQKQQQQRQHLSSQEAGRAAPASARAVAQHVYRAGGIRALYRGLSATIWRDVGGFGLYFYGYEGTLRLFAPDSMDPALDDGVVNVPSSRPWAPLLAGGAAGVLGWIATFPFDVLKTRLQAGTIGSGTGTGTVVDADAGLDTSSWRTARKMYAESGGRVFLRGLVPTLMRAIPVNMAVFGTFEGVVWTFSRT